MTLSGIPGVTADAPKYLQKALLPDRTDAEAVAELTRSVDAVILHTYARTTDGRPENILPLVPFIGWVKGNIPTT